MPQTRVRIRATGSVNYGRSIPEYPEEFGGGTTLPDPRDLREAWPEGVTLPRAINFNLGCTSLGLPAVASDLAVLDKRAAVLLDRHVPGYREIIASELPCFIREPVAVIFGRSLAETIAKRCLLAAASLWVDVRVREELVSAPASLFAMLYLRYIAEDADSWDETKEHESTVTRERRIICDTVAISPRYAAHVRDSGGASFRTSSITTTRRGCSWLASSPSKRSASSSIFASKAGCARSRSRCRARCASSGRRCASSGATR